MAAIGRMLMILGAAALAVGVVVWLLGRLRFRGLPGDIHYHGEHGSFYFPIVTCLVLSALLTLALWIWQWMQHR